VNIEESIYQITKYKIKKRESRDPKMQGGVENAKRACARFMKKTSQTKNQTLSNKFIRCQNKFQLFVNI